MKLETIDTAAITGAASKATGAGSALTVLGWLTSSNFGMWIGIFIGIAGLVVNWYFKMRTDKRAEAVHAAYMRKLLQDEVGALQTKAMELDE